MNDSSPIRLARAAALALKTKYGEGVSSVHLQNGEVIVTLAPDQPLDADIESIADVIYRFDGAGNRTLLKNRDNPIPKAT